VADANRFTNPVEKPGSARIRREHSRPWRLRFTCRPVLPGSVGRSSNSLKKLPHA
jgi:hypothetical protein